MTSWKCGNDPMEGGPWPHGSATMTSSQGGDAPCDPVFSLRRFPGRGASSGDDLLPDPDERRRCQRDVTPLRRNF